MSGVQHSRWALVVALVGMLAGISVLVRNWDEIEPLWPQLAVLIALILAGVVALALRIARHHAEGGAQ